MRRQHVELASLSSSFPLNWFKDGTRQITYRTSLGFLERKGSRRQGGVRGKLPETGKILSNIQAHRLTAFPVHSMTSTCSSHFCISCASAFLLSIDPILTHLVTSKSDPAGGVCLLGNVVTGLASSTIIELTLLELRP